MTNFSRRQFVISAASLAALAPGVARGARASDVPWAGEKVVDCHFHERPTTEAMIAHLDGAGVSSALVLAFSDFGPRLAKLRSQHPGRFLGWSRGGKLTTVGVIGGIGTEPPAEYDMTRPVVVGRRDPRLPAFARAKATGWKGFAETVGRVEVDGPELQRLYALAAELDVPVMMHFQTNGVPGQPVYGIRGFGRIEAMLRRYPKTTFVCHSSDFWGSIDAKFVEGGAYPTGKVARGGLSDRLLADYPNMHGDLGAPSALMQLARDPEFTAEFLQRHQHKLMFGSDCGCVDGRGGSAAATTATAAGSGGAAVDLQQRMAARSGLANICVARELLKVAWNATSRDQFRNLVWNNAVRTYKLEV